ncbi:MAG: phospholipid carrier-dependent glycosyltransferase [Candidatus Limnocylindrales bacterium]
MSWRSATLAGEPPGRVDRLDLLLILLVVLIALVLRAWRVGEPPDMYFDEVYHARTATEFLQDWKYGEPHSIYEYTHPHLAKYLIAAGLVAFGKNEVSATTELGYPARDAAVETAWDDPLSGSGPGGGDRLYVSGPGSVRVYDLATRALVASIALPDAAEPGQMAVDDSTHRLLVADQSGALWAFDTTALDALRTGADAASLPDAFALGNLGGPVRAMVVDTTASVVLAALDDGHIVTLDAGTGSRLATTTVPGAVDVIGVAGGERLIVDAAAAPSTEADTLAGLLGRDAASVREQLAAASGDVVVAASLTAAQRDAVQAAIDKRTLTASRLETGRLAAVAATEGLVLLDLDTLARSQAFPMPLPATGVTLVDKVSTPTLYVATGSELDRIEVASDSPPAERDPVWMPGPIRAVLFDPATKLVHALGARPDGQGETVYVVEPHANAVYADAPLPKDPVAWALDAQPDHPGADREQLLTVAADGSLAVVEVGGNAFGWRFPGVIAGALMAGFLYLLARLLVRRRGVALLAVALVLLDGMAFAQARIAMNDTYVGLFIVAAYAIFAALWLGVWRGRSAILLGLPLVGVMLGLALASKWVGLYAIGGIVLLVLLRSALGRVIALLAMIAMSGVLGWLAISAPSSGSPGVVGMSVATALVVLVTLLVLRRLGVSGTVIAAGTLFAAITAAVLLLVKGDALFLVLMVALTLTLAVAMVLRPVFLTLEELRFGVIVPGVAGAIVGLGSILLRDRLPTEGLFSSGSLLIVGMLLVGVAIAAYAVVAFAGRRGVGPLAPLPAPDAPEARLEPAAPAPDGWLLPGWRLGIPWLWALLCFTALPLAIYVASYIPWVALGNRWTETFPAGNTGQTFLALQVQMYEYHNNLRATHAASSPWWAWPFDLKPVWFYLGSTPGRTALIYDAGNLVIFWLSVPAMLWSAWMAWQRRSLGLGLVVIAFACQWLAWSRVDRATFQYHYFTSLPFVIMALAYFLAELWHGPSARTWLYARIAVAAAIVATPVLWLLRDPLCAVSGVLRVNPTSQACGYVRESFVLSDRVALGLVVLAIGLGVIAWRRRRMLAAAMGPDVPWAADRGWRAFGAWLVASMAVTGAVLVLIISVVPETPLISAPIGLIAWYLVAAALLIPFAYAAWIALGVRDPRRYVAGVFVAAGLWFILFYPDIAALPLPTGLARLFQVLPLPTYNYDFQFAVNTAAAVATPIFSVEALALAAMVAFLALAAMYATWTWRLATAAEAAAREVEGAATVS